MYKILPIFILSVFAFQTVFASFPDTELSFYRDSIEQLSSEGIISGYDDGTFGADNTITRAEMLKILFGTK